MDGGWIKLYKSILQWEWWDEPIMVKSYLAMLLKCNWQPTRWHGIELAAGQFITSLDGLAHELHISVQQARTVLRRLRDTGEITITATNRYTLITVCNWAAYQMPDNEQSNKQNNTDKCLIESALNNCGNKQATNSQQANSKQATTEEDNKDNKDNPPYTPPIADDMQSCLPFAMFWDMYGKKVDKEKCKRKYAKISETDRAAIKVALPRYVAAHQDLQYRKNPVTWLNGRCWQDEWQPAADASTVQAKSKDYNGI